MGNALDKPRNSFVMLMHLQNYLFRLKIIERSCQSNRIKAQKYAITMLIGNSILEFRAV